MTNDTLSPEPEAAEVPAPRRRSFRLPEEIGVIVALLVMIVVIGVARPRFLNPINLLTILGNTTLEGMLSLGMVFLLAIREIDLSVGWMFNFSAVVAALMMVAGFNPWLAALAGVGFGAVLGLGQRRARNRPWAAIDHRHAGNVFNVRGVVARRQPRPRGVSDRPVEQLLRVRLDENISRRSGRWNPFCGVGHCLAHRAPPYAVRLPG